MYSIFIAAGPLTILIALNTIMIIASVCNKRKHRRRHEVPMHRVPANNNVHAVKHEHKDDRQHTNNGGAHLCTFDRTCPCAYGRLIL
jgi:hypothetical protein